jgi:hypothetical protein
MESEHDPWCNVPDHAAGIQHCRRDVSRESALGRLVAEVTTPSAGERLAPEQLEERDGWLLPGDGPREPQHTCGLCCESYDYVMEGAGFWFTEVRDYMDSRPSWWRWVHPLAWQRMTGRRIALADVLDEAGK